MFKNKKLLIIISLLIILLLSILLIFKFNYYSRNQILNLINLGKDFPNNIHINITQKNNNNLIGTIDKYIKDKNIYIKQQENGALVENLYDIKNSSQITIIHNEKHINTNNNYTYINSTDYENLFKDIIDTSFDYKYYGKETINNKNYIKFSLSKREAHQITEYLYYLNLNTNKISKIEIIIKDISNNIIKKDEFIYTYSYNVVTDNDILKFDINNYSDYTKS